MEVKAFEVRDRATMMPAMAIRMTPANDRERWLLEKAGYRGTEDLILFGHMEGGAFHYDEHDTSTSTRRTAIPYIRENWDRLKTGDVICTEFIRGERTEPKASEQFERSADGDAELARLWGSWLATQPAAVQEVARKFPLGTSFNIHGTRMYVVAYTDAGSVSISPIDPILDYDGAVATRRTVCKCCKDQLDALVIKRGL